MILLDGSGSGSKVKGDRRMVEQPTSKALYDHYLGASNANNIHKRAENISQLKNQFWMNTMNAKRSR